MKKFLNFLLGLLSFLILLALTFAITIKKEFKPETLKKTLVNTDFSFILDDMDEEDKEILEAVEEALTYMKIPSNISKKLLNSPGTKNFIGIYLSNTVDYLLDDSKNIPLTGNDIKELFKSNLDIIQSELPSQDKKFLEKYENEMYEYIDKNGKEILAFFPEPKEILKDFDTESITIYNNITLKDLTNFITFITSNNFITALSISLGLIFIIIIAINLKNQKYLPVIANTLFTYFIFIGIVLILIYLGLNYIVNDIPILYEFIKNTLNYFWIGLITSLIISIIFRIIYSTLKRKHSNKKLA